jgi:hypothetical protein
VSTPANVVDTDIDVFLANAQEIQGRCREM